MKGIDVCGKYDAPSLTTVLLSFSTLFMLRLLEFGVLSLSIEGKVKEGIGPPHKVTEDEPKRMTLSE